MEALHGDLSTSIHSSTSSSSSSDFNHQPNSLHPLQSAPPTAIAAHSTPTQSTYDSLSLKRKRPYLSFPPSPPETESVILEDIEEEYQRKPWKRRLGTVGSETERKTTWQGRGRSPYKTPVTAVLDSIKGDTRLLEHLEKELIIQKEHLQELVASKQREIVVSMDQRQATLHDHLPPELTQGPIFPPPKPNTSRSPSPARRILKALPSATPSVINSSLESFTNPLPQDVTDLLDSLLDGLGEGSIPMQCQKDFKELEPNTRVPRQAYNQLYHHSLESAQKLRRHALKIKKQTQVCEEDRKDENAWSMEVVRRVLKWERPSEDNARVEPPFSRLEYIQSQSINAEFLPKFPPEGTRIPKKTDLALSFSKQHPDIEDRYAALRHPNEEPPVLSQLGDDYTSNIVLFAFAEVKRHGEGEANAQAQLFTMFASGISMMRKHCSALEGGQQTRILPLLGWSVVGHDWKFYIAYGEGNGVGDPVRILGPLDGGAVSTRGLVGVFKLLQLVERIKKWARDTYWLWVVEEVLEPLVNRATERRARDSISGMQY